MRSFNLIKHLARKYRLCLGAFIDDPVDRRYEVRLREMCQEVCLVELNPRVKKLRSLQGLVSREPLSLPYFRDRRLASWVHSTIRDYGIAKVVVYSSPMAQYVFGRTAPAGLHRVVDFVDADSEKWRHYSKLQPWPLSRLYAREAERLLVYERGVAVAANVSVFVSAEEAKLFAELAPEAAARVVYIENGVDTDFFSPERGYPNPYPEGTKALVFTGAMDYWANIDAVTWFVKYALPSIRTQSPNARFYIVGARPTKAVRRLEAVAGVTVTGGVKDIRPFLKHAVAAVAPLRVARGIQNKVLEAMAMAKPVLATSAAMDGLRVDGGFYRLISDRADGIAGHAIELLNVGDVASLGEQGRALVSREYAWGTHVTRFERLLDEHSNASQWQTCGAARVRSSLLSEMLS